MLPHSPDLQFGLATLAYESAENQYPQHIIPKIDNISTPYETGISLVFPLQRELQGILPFHPKYLPKVTYLRAKHVDFNQGCWLSRAACQPLQATAWRSNTRCKPARATMTSGTVVGINSVLNVHQPNHTAVARSLCIS